MGFADQLKKAAPVAKARFTLDTITLGAKDEAGRDLAPVLILRHAGESNGAYSSALLKAANDLRSRAGNARLTEAKLKENRELDIKLFAKYVLVGWENVCEEPGVATPFTADKAEELLTAIAAERPDLLGAITSFARDADNFREASPDVEALGKR